MSTAGPPQGAKAPLGGSDMRAAQERGGACPTAGPPQGAKAPSASEAQGKPAPGGSDMRAAQERAGARSVRVPRRPVHGVLVLDKPLGMSSNQALQKVKWLLRAEKGGHTGTLDPLATGVLPLCFGAATKFSQAHLDADKSYAATLRLGARTSTGDAEGDVVASRPVPQIDPTMLAALAQRLTGRQQQTPPMHSALKRDGRPLYEWARQGLEMPRDAREIDVFSLDLAMAIAPSPYVSIEMIAHVSKGTYIRTLAETVGEALGCGAHLTALRRLRSGPFAIDQAVTLDDLAAMDDSARLGALLPLECLLPGHEPVMLGAEDAGRFLSGLRRRGGWPDTPAVRVHGPTGPLLGTAHIMAGELIPDRLLNPLEVAALTAAASPSP